MGGRAAFVAVTLGIAGRDKWFTLSFKNVFSDDSNQKILRQSNRCYSTRLNQGEYIPEGSVEELTFGTVYAPTFAKMVGMVVNAGSVFQWNIRVTTRQPLHRDGCGQSS